MIWEKQHSMYEYGIDILSNGHTIATVHLIDDKEDGDAFKRQEFNARLIAAAPDLFNAICLHLANGLVESDCEDELIAAFKLVSNEKTWKDKEEEENE